MARKYPITVIRNTADFAAAFEAQKEGELYCLFTGAIEESTEKCEHNIDSFLDDQENIKVLVCTCIRDEYKGHPEHAYRVNPLIKLQSIPTLIRYHDGVEKGRVVELNCNNEDMLYDLADL
ncbi:hypothetical protein WA158_001263 [Blastocystis sp. Blastoise]